MDLLKLKISYAVLGGGIALVFAAIVEFCSGPEPQTVPKRGPSEQVAPSR